MGTQANRFHRCLLAGLPVLLLTLLSIVANARAPLYERIGGAQKITALVDEYVEALSSDSRTRRAFDKTDLKRIKREFANQLCELTGGPCKYGGDTMHDVHAGQHIDEREFLSGVELLREVLLRQHIAIRERNELLALLAPMKHDVVQP